MSEKSNNQGSSGTSSATTNSNTRTGKGKGRNRGRGKKPSTIAAVPKPKFTGSCKKDLEGVVIIHNPNKQIMTKQFIDFDERIVQAGGKISSAMSRALKDKQQIGRMFFMPAISKADASEYTDADGTVDEDRKLYCSKLRESDIPEAAKERSKFQEDWKRMFHRIMGQLCPDTRTRLARSDEWLDIDNSSDPGRLMTLLQTVCLHGSEKEYLPEKIYMSMKEMLGRKQGNNEPADFSKQTGSNNDVFAQVAGFVTGEPIVGMPTFWGCLPNLRRYTINKFPLEFPFDPNDLGQQSDAVKELLSYRCNDIGMAFIMTNNSSQIRSDMNLEVHKNLLANHPDAFATNRTKATDQLIGYEGIKSKSRSSNGNNNAAKHDVSEAVVLVNAPGSGNTPRNNRDNANDISCWYCQEEGHYRNECPKRIADASNSDTVKTAVLIHLGDGGNDDESHQDDLDEMSVDDEEGPELDALCFHTSVCFDDAEGVDPEDIEDLPDVDDNGDVVVNGNDNPEENLDFDGNVVPLGTNGLEILDGDESDFVNHDDHVEYNVDDLPELNAILQKVRITQNKPLLWSEQMERKFASIGIHNSLDLATAMDYESINRRFKAEGLKTLHSTTILGIDSALHKTKVYGDHLSPSNIDAHLQDEVELSRVFRIVGEQLDKANMPSWINAIIFKLRCIRITNVTKLHASITNKTLNGNLRACGFVPLFEVTLLALVIPLRCSVQNANRTPRGHRIEPDSDFRHGQV